MLRFILCFCAALIVPLNGLQAATMAPGSAVLAAANVQVQEFYALRHGELAWSGNPQAQAQARIARTIVAGAAADGLDPDAYAATSSGDSSRDDAALTLAMISYLRDLAVGRDELRSLDTDIGLSIRQTDVARLLYDALRQGSLANLPARLAPSHPAYGALKTALAGIPDQTKRDVLAANMERWRWLPERLEPDRIEVNAATAELTLWLAGRQMLSSRVIVGKPATRTPMLRAEGAGLTINPAWNVPHSIAVKEILPKLKRNHAWLASQEMVLLNGPAGDPHGLTVNWRAIPAGSFPYRIRQVPGPRNPLGQIKLELPNRFDVFLHDTPGKAAFNRSSRAQSHGCVRVEQILPLASYALAADQAAVAKIQEAIGQGQTQYLGFSRKLPIYVLYWTAVPEADGTIRFAQDIYGRDRRMIDAMHRQLLRVAAIEPGCRKA